jgi:hypothetical protein
VLHDGVARRRLGEISRVLAGRSLLCLKLRTLRQPNGELAGKNFNTLLKQHAFRTALIGRLLHSVSDPIHTSVSEVQFRKNP